MLTNGFSWIETEVMDANDRLSDYLAIGSWTVLRRINTTRIVSWLGI